uniref:fimbrial protein n=1 Tax=Halomonas sp. TaxID=1486246 RepID=UPI00261A8E9C|nr:fimbrial protein [Halomonas sp.]
MKLSTKLLMAACCSVMSGSVFAIDGTIDISGTVTDTSCTVTINGGSASSSVVLPTVSTASLTSNGAVAGATAFTFNLTECPATGGARAYFESTNVDSSTGNLVNNSATPAGNTQVQIIDAGGTSIDLRNNENNPFVSFDTSGNANLTYSAQYIAVGGAATPGDIDTQLVYTVEYQ